MKQSSMNQELSTSSEGLAVVTNFTGNYTRIIEPTRSYFANGTWSGFGVIDAVYTNFTETPGACDQDVTGDILPENETVCLVNGTTSKYIFSGTVEAKGQVVANTTVTPVRALNGENFEASGTFEEVVLSTVQGLLSVLEPLAVRLLNRVHFT